METKLTQHLTIGVTESGEAAISASPSLDCATAFQLVGTLALHLLNAYYKVAETDLTVNHNSGATPKEAKLSESELSAALVGIEESMYDAMDSVFSNVLYNFYPSSAKYELEDEAILELTNQKIKERYEQLTDEEKKLYTASYAKMREYIASRMKVEDDNATGSEAEEA